MGAINASDNLTDSDSGILQEDSNPIQEDKYDIPEESSKNDSSINVSDIECNYGETGTATFSAEGCSVDADNVSVIDHPEAVIGVNNSIITVSGLNAGNYTLKVITTPDENHNSVTATASILIKKYHVTIFVSVIEYDYGGIGTTPVSVEGGEITNISVVAHPEAIIGYDGNEISVHGLDVYYFYTLEIIVKGDENHRDSSATTIIFVNKGDSQLNISGFEFVEGKNGTTTFNIIGAELYENDIEVIGHPEAIISLDGNVIGVSGLFEGNYTLHATTTPDKNHNAVETSLNFTVVSFPISDSTGENLTIDDKLALNLPIDAKGTLNLYIDGEKVHEWNVNGSDQEYSVYIGELNLSYGKHNYSFEYISTCSYPNKSVNGSFILNIKTRESPRIAANDLSVMYCDGSKYSVTVYDDGKPARDVAVTFKVGNRNIVARTDANGVATIRITDAPKSYKITIQALGLSVTKKLTVKHILTLKKVKVKRSAKRLVIKATLKKVNGKYLKGKKITLKFKGKKYKAKTNKKGLAKFIIKGKVLKKLKKGRKITYRATYLKDTVKRTVKIK